MKYLSRIFPLIAFFLVAFICSSAVHAQDLDDVTLFGRITDPNGLPIVGGTVTATHIESATSRTNITDGVSGQNLKLDFQLAPADVQAQATVTVTDEDAPAIDTERTVVGGTISEREIEEIPNANRNPLDLVLTLGGTSEESLSSSGLAEDSLQNPSGTPLEQGNFSLSGGTAYSNEI